MTRATLVSLVILRTLACAPWVDHTDVPLGVHWHGLELESWADGVPGWSGMPGSVVPPSLPAIPSPSV